jgi:serine/threonine protein kinase
VATRRDLDLAQRLLAARVLTEDQVRDALNAQSDWLRAGRSVPIEQALYSRGFLPRGCLDAPGDPAVVQPFSGYRVAGALGTGGSSTVYGGFYEENGAPVAIKVLEMVAALRQTFVDRFRAEAMLLIELEHENIVGGYECGFENGLHFFSMDFVEGATVLEVIDARGRLTNEEALSITLQMARALDFLHQRGLLHRDVKPGNAMIDVDGSVRLIDLGLVCRMDEQGEGDRDQLTVGTVEYLSPEQARGRTDLDARSDIYSLGLTLYQMVVGEVPFRGETDYEVMAKQIMTSMDAQKLKHRQITPEIYFFITKMTAKERESRWSSAAELCRAIEGYLPSGPVPVDLGREPLRMPEPPPLPRAEPPRPPPRGPAPRGDAPPSGPVRRRRRYR